MSVCCPVSISGPKCPVLRESIQLSKSIAKKRQSLLLPSPMGMAGMYPSRAHLVTVRWFRPPRYCAASSEVRKRCLITSQELPILLNTDLGPSTQLIILGTVNFSKSLPRNFSRDSGPEPWIRRGEIALSRYQPRYRSENAFFFFLRHGL